MILHLKKVLKNKKSILMLVFPALVLVSILVFLSGCFQNQTNQTIRKRPPKAVDGKLELSNWDFRKDGSIKLNGQWEFYWNKLLTPDDLNRSTTSYQKSIERVPRTWKLYKFEGRSLPDEGYATFRLSVKLQHLPENLAIHTTAFISSCKIWVDNVKVFESGIVGEKPENSKGSFKPQTIAYSCPDF